MTPQEIIDVDQQHVWHPYAAMPNAIPCFPVQTAQGVEITMADGNVLIDGMSSWWAAIHGYNHPVLSQAAKEQIDKMSHIMFGGLTHEPAVQLAKKLVEVAPSSLQHVFYCDSGSVAIEVGMKMALQYWYNLDPKTPKHRFLTIRGGYHGDTFKAMSVCDPVNGMHHLFSKVLPEQIFVQRPQVGVYDEWDENDMEPLRTQLEQRHKDIAAIILEPIVQGAGGMRFYHPNYLRRVRELCDEFDVLLILDEIATGFGRTGKLFASEHANIEPDILCIGKALSGGFLSFAATMTTTKISQVFAQGEAGVFMHGPTFMGNPLACAVSLVSLNLLLDAEYDWKTKVQNIERQLKEELAPCKESPLVQDVRVLGAIGVVEMKEPFDMKIVQPAVVDHGVWLRPFGKLLYTMPPFITQPNQLRKITQAMVSLTSPQKRGYSTTTARTNNSQKRGYSTTARTNNSHNSLFNDPDANDLSPKVRSVYDASDDWEDWFSPEEYGNAWEREHTTRKVDEINNNALEKRRSMILEDLAGDSKLDSASRHLIHQLQCLYHDGFSRQGEIITTRRCNEMIARLLQSAELLSKKENAKAMGFTEDNGALAMRQRVFRAEAILRTMELFWDYVPDLIEDTDPQRRMLKTTTGVGYSSTIKPAVKWPVPSYEIYVEVLRGLSSVRAPKQYQTTVHNSDVTWTCQNVMLRLHRFYQTKGFVYLKRPPVEDWNQVLLAWANAHGDRDHPEKALHATQFFMDMVLLYNVQPDSSSYSHVMRACAHHDMNELAKELGAKVAVRFWNEHMKDELKMQSFTPTPYMFVFFMRAISGLPEATEVEKYLKEAWEGACLAGVVNKHVLYDFQVSSPKFFKEQLKEYKDKVDTDEINKSPSTAYDRRYQEAIMEFLPREWKRNVEVTPEGLNGDTETINILTKRSTK